MSQYAYNIFSAPKNYYCLFHMISINYYTHFQINHWSRLYHVDTCISVFFHLSYNPVSTHSINQNNYYVSSKSIYHCLVETVWLAMPKKNIHTISDFTKCCYIVMISHVSSRPNWYWTHAVCDHFFFSKIVIILVIQKPCDHEIPS